MLIAKEMQIKGRFPMGPPHTLHIYSYEYGLVLEYEYVYLTPPQAAAHATPVKSPRSKRVLPPEGTIESINLDAVPQSGPRLDNAAAKHKLSVKPKNQRVSRKHRRVTQVKIFTAYLIKKHSSCSETCIL